MSKATSGDPSLEKAIVGCLLGTAVGDALGLPCEGLTKRRQSRLYPNLDHYHFLFGRGMVSDDTEHTVLTAQSLIVSDGDPDKFRRELSRRMRFWLLGCPAGVGFATLRALMKLWLGFGPERSGVFSAGNGPAMRSALLGICFGQDPVQLRQLVTISARLTHTDPKAEFGAFAIALAAWCAANPPVPAPKEFYGLLCRSLDDEAQVFLELVKQAAESADAGQTAQQFASQIGCENGVSGYVYHTVPVALQVWFHKPGSFSEGLQEIIRCGGDTDSTAAIVGGLLGASCGKEHIPARWLEGLWEMPRSVAWMEALGKRLSEVVQDRRPGRALPVPFGVTGCRNLLFIVVVLAHGLRRLAPPY